MSRKSCSLFLLALFVVPGLAGTATSQTASRVYWTEWYSYNAEMCRIARADVDGSNVETILDGFVEPVGVKDLVIDSNAGKLYFANRSVGLIERSNLDGSARETVVEGVNPIGMDLDVPGGKIYWADYTYSNPRIRRADLDGTDVEDLASATAGCSLEGIVLDLAARHVYFAERMTQHIKRCNMDGGGTVLILACWEGVGHPRGLALANGRIYWASDVSIYSATLAGDDVQPLVTDLPDKPYMLELDAEAGKLYWVTGSSYGNGLVQRINLNGTGLETLVEGLYGGFGAAIEIGGAVPVADRTPTVVTLASSPNPFNPRTRLAYYLPSAGPTRLIVCDPRGRLVRTLVDAAQAAGDHAVVWDGRDDRGRSQSSGVYFAQLHACGLVASQKMVLMK